MSNSNWFYSAILVFLIMRMSAMFLYIFIETEDITKKQTTFEFQKK